MQFNQELTDFYNEDSEPIKCEHCGNTKEWRIAFSATDAEVREGKVFTNPPKGITKPDDILWICGNCKTLVLDGSW